MAIDEVSGNLPGRADRLNAPGGIHLQGLPGSVGGGDVPVNGPNMILGVDETHKRLYVKLGGNTEYLVPKSTLDTLYEPLGGGGGGGQPLDDDLTAIAALTTQPFGRSLLTAADAAAARALLGVGTGTGDMVRSTYDPNLDGVIAVAQGGTGATTVLGAQQALDLEVEVDVQPFSNTLLLLSVLTMAADKVPYFTGSIGASTMTVTAAARTVLDDTTVGAMLTTLGGAPLASPTFTGDPKAPTATAGDNDTSIATTAFVATAVAAAVGGSTPTGPAGGALSGTYPNPGLASALGGAGLTFATNVLAVGAGTGISVAADAVAVDTAVIAPLASPTFTGDPKAPTPLAADNDTSIATTAFVTSAITTAAGSYQPLDSDLTSIASITTTSFGRGLLALANGAALLSAAGGAAAVHTHVEADVTNLVTDLAAKAPLASPTFTGTPAAPTATGGTNTTQLATTAFVTSAVSTAAGSYQPLDSDLTSIAALTTLAFGRSLLTALDAAAGRTLLGAAASSHTHAESEITNLVTDLAGKAASVHTHAEADVTNLVTDLAAKAPLASPALTGNPTAPTATAGDNDTSIATTAFVTAAVATGGGSYQPLDSDLTSIAALTTTATGRSLLAAVDAAAIRTIASAAAATHTHAESDVTNLVTDLAGKAPTVHTHAEADVTNLVTDLAAKAPLASPTFTGTPAAPTATGGTNTTQLATTAFVTSAISGAAGSYQPLDSDLTAIAALTTQPVGRSLLGAVDAAAIRAIAGAGTGSGDMLRSVYDPNTDGVIGFAQGGTNATSVGGAQDSLQLTPGTYTQAFDLELQLLATGVTAAADKVPYFTSGVAATTMTVTAAARTVLDDTTVAAMLATLGGAPLVHTHVESDVTNLVSDLALKAPLASPTFTGTVTIPTAAITTLSGTPNFTGAATGLTAAALTNTTQLATTAFVTGAISTAAGGYQPLDADLTSIAALTTTSFGRGLLALANQAALLAAAGGAAAVHTHVESDVTNLVSDLALKAPLASPALTGTPTAPTAGLTVNTTQLATTAFVKAMGGPNFVTTYGADPTGATDCLAILNTVIAAFAAGTIKTLEVPAGRYLLNGNPNALTGNGITIIGRGQYGSQFVAGTGNTGRLFQFGTETDSGDASTTVCRNVEIYELGFDCTTVAPGSGQYPIDARNCNDVVVANCYFDKPANLVRVGGTNATAPTKGQAFFMRNIRGNWRGDLASKVINLRAYTKVILENIDFQADASGGDHVGSQYLIAIEPHQAGGDVVQMNKVQVRGKDTPNGTSHGILIDYSSKDAGNIVLRDIGVDETTVAGITLKSSGTLTTEARHILLDNISNGSDSGENIVIDHQNLGAILDVRFRACQFTHKSGSRAITANTVNMNKVDGLVFEGCDIAYGSSGALTAHCRLNIPFKLLGNHFKTRGAGTVSYAVETTDIATNNFICSGNDALDVGTRFFNHAAYTTMPGNRVVAANLPDDMTNYALLDGNQTFSGLNLFKRTSDAVGMRIERGTDTAPTQPLLQFRTNAGVGLSNVNEQGVWVGPANLNGTPTAPTAGGGTSTTQIATTAFVQSALPAAAIPLSLIDNKGDLLVGSANDTAIKLPATTNGFILTLDSSVSAGMKWAAAAGGGDMLKATYDADADGIIAIAQGGTGASSQGAARTALGVAIGSQVQAWDADLDSIAALTTTATGRSLLAATDAAAIRVIAGAQALDTDLTAIAALTSAADQVPYATGAGTWALTTVTSVARTVLDDTTVAAMLTTLGGATLASTGNAFTGPNTFNRGSDNPSLRVLRGTDTAPTGDIFQVRDNANVNSLLRVGPNGELTAASLTFTVADLAISEGGTGQSTASAARAALAPENLGYVNHGATAGTARPTGYAAVLWVGTVTPTNAVDGDVWIDVT